ncbi:MULTISPECIES: glutamine amidotransferase [unclassified Rhodococcus (in: high G+C Gram-positive bacteria)]|uniref:glutamine amidotransferase n=1 Tax=unclassified Rhodococcus (in: high G+C Gram-positive bacteria) TaxID=192944 RepID=UPI00163A1574|nr:MULTISPECIES: glutamine amidotransferase [unclassified Rhodococcus (in: high G+C Gram-positive bacteria)]MBC2637902.1 cytoplasmic protein [Rhodococcus sp. 3A]MBC2897350.1 cytoplasmic protein [Rhodococcus sp. 4CII]
MTSTKDGATRVLVVGESWIKHTVHIKGFDEFRTVEYEEGGGVFLDSLDASGLDVTYLRAHEISGRFPKTLEELQQFDVVVLSDIGANSFLLADETFLRSERSVNRLSLLAAFTEAGGGLIMVGGYMSFTGIDGKARYGMSPLAPVLPVTMLDYDDRIEVPEGLDATFDEPNHVILGGTPAEWPMLLGYNRVIAKSDATVVARFGEDPLLVVGTAGVGRTVAFASDLAPHWAPPEFVQWQHYQALWTSIVNWAAGLDTSLPSPVHAVAAVD